MFDFDKAICRNKDMVMFKDVFKGESTLTSIP